MIITIKERLPQTIRRCRAKKGNLFGMRKVCEYFFQQDEVIISRHLIILRLALSCLDFLSPLPPLLNCVSNLVVSQMRVASIAYLSMFLVC